MFAVHTFMSSAENNKVVHFFKLLLYNELSETEGSIGHVFKIYLISKLSLEFYIKHRGSDIHTNW
jgi:hypothetical protein